MCVPVRITEEHHERQSFRTTSGENQDYRCSGLWRFAYPVNNGLSVVAFDIGDNAISSTFAASVFDDIAFAKSICRTQVIQINSLTETTD